MNNHVLQKNKHSPPARHSLLKNRRRRTEKGYDLTTITFHHPTRPCIANARIVNRDGLQSFYYMHVPNLLDVSTKTKV